MWYLPTKRLNTPANAQGDYIYQLGDKDKILTDGPVKKVTITFVNLIFF